MTPIELHQKLEEEVLDIFAVDYLLNMAIDDEAYEHAEVIRRHREFRVNGEALLV